MEIASRFRSPRLFHAIAVFSILQGGHSQTPPASIYVWSATGLLADARHSACVAALDDGRGFVAGGEGIPGLLASVELYQSDGHFLPGARLLHARSHHTCTVLHDGRVLVAGGRGAPYLFRPRHERLSDNGASLAENDASRDDATGHDVAHRPSGAAPAEIYDPATDSWSELETPGVPRWNHSATLLPDGSVLLAGGENTAGASRDLEIFNPLTDRITLLAAKLSSPRTNHAAAALRDGRVLILGGTDGTQLLSSVDVYNPDGTVTQELRLPEARASHSATTLDDGRVLIAGGEGAEGDLNSALLYSPADNTFHPVGPMTLGRYGHLAFLLPGNGSIMIVGGIAGGVATASTELFDPDTATFTAAGPLTAARRNLAGAPLKLPGVVLVVGGLSNKDAPLANCGTFVTPVLTLDKSMYAQGDNVTVSGANWPSAAALPINAIVKTLTQTSSLGTFNTTTNSAGAFQAPGILPAPLSADTAGGALTFSTHITVTVNGAVRNLVASVGATQLDPTTTVLRTSATKVLTQDKITLSANVRMAAPNVTMQGFVTFFDGRARLGTASTSAAPAGSPGAPTPGSTYTFDVNGNNFFTLPNVILAAGTRSLEATFTPTSTIIGQSADSAQVLVEKRSTLLDFTVPLKGVTSVAVGQALHLSAAVKPATTSPISILPTGAVQVFRDPVPSFIGIDLTPNSSLGQSAGNASIVAGPAGTLSLTAGYPGDDNYLPSPTSTASVTISKGTVSFTVTPSPVSTTAGALVNLTSKLQHPAAPGAPVTGTVSVVNGPTNLSTATVTVSPDFNNGSAVSTPLQTYVRDAGSKTIQVHYSGDANYLAADTQVPATVNKIAPDLVITNFNPICCDLPFTFRIDVNPPGSLFAPQPPTGVFDTFADGIGELDLFGDCALSTNSDGRGAGCVPKAALTSGVLIGCSTTLDFTFTYHGDSNYQSKSITVTKTVPIVNCH